ncbi:MAG: hypothetical protein J5814_01325 [Bacteroidaceae bacterium]|nr:hypothetical protein [Bacteroidaceae bacterium]
MKVKDRLPDGEKTQDGLTVNERDYVKKKGFGWGIFGKSPSVLKGISLLDKEISQSHFIVPSRRNT